MFCAEAQILCAGAQLLSHASLPFGLSSTQAFQNALLVGGRVLDERIGSASQERSAMIALSSVGHQFLSSRDRQQASRYVQPPNILRTIRTP
jgi:hypothetical protein